MKFHFFKTLLDDVRAGIVENIISLLTKNNIHSILLSSPIIIQTSANTGEVILGIEETGRVNLAGKSNHLTDTFLTDLSIEDLITLLQSVEEGRYQIWDDAMINA